MSNNPMVDAQLNKHEDEIAKAKNDIYLQGLGLKWCEEHITALEKKSGTELPSEVSSLIAQNSHTEQLYKGMVREADGYRNRFTETNEKLTLLKENDRLKTEVNWYKTQYDEKRIEIHRLKSETDDIEAIKEQLNADFGILAENHKALGKQYADLKLRYENMACQAGKLRDELKDKEASIKMLKDDLDEKTKLEIECATIKQELGDQLYYRDLEVKSLKEKINDHKTEILALKTRCANKTIECNKIKKERLDLKQERDALTEELAKYSWKRVDTSKILPFHDHDLYLFAIDGYPTPVKGKFHDDTLSKITIIVDDGKGKGPEQKVIFFIDGHIRYWRPLPEMPDMPEGVDE